MVVMLGSYLKTRLVVVVVEKLVYDQESRPVSAARKSDADFREISFLRSPKMGFSNSE